MVSKVSELREALVKDLNEEGWEPHHLAAAEKAVDALIFAVREECAEAEQPCNCGYVKKNTMEILWVCGVCGEKRSVDAYGFEACARVKP